MTKVAQLLRVSTAETVRKCVRWAQVAGGALPGASSEESAEVKRLKRGNAELRRANSILTSAAARVCSLSLQPPGLPFSDRATEAFMTEVASRVQTGTSASSCPRPASQNVTEEAPGEDVQILLAKFALLDQFYGRPERSPGSLAEVASSAVSTIGAAWCAAVILWHGGTVRVEAAPHPVAGQLEQLQRRLNQGPTLEVLVAGQSHSVHLAGMIELGDRVESGASPKRFPDLAGHLRTWGSGRSCLCG